MATAIKYGLIGAGISVAIITVVQGVGTKPKWRATAVEKRICFDKGSNLITSIIEASADTNAVIKDKDGSPIRVERGIFQATEQGTLKQQVLINDMAPEAYRDQFIARCMAGKAAPAAG